MTPTPQPPLLWLPQVHSLLSVTCQIRPEMRIKYPSFLHAFAAHPLTPPSPATAEPGILQATVRGRRVGRPELPGGAKAPGCTLPSHQAEVGD